MKKPRKRPAVRKEGSGQVRESTEEVMRPRYSFAGGERGRYAARYAKGSNVVVLDPDVAVVFRTSKEVNRVLREHLKAFT